MKITPERISVGFFLFLTVIFFIGNVSKAEVDAPLVKATDKQWGVLVGYGATHTDLGETKAHVETIDFVLGFEKERIMKTRGLVHQPDGFVPHGVFNRLFHMIWLNCSLVMLTYIFSSLVETTPARILMMSSQPQVLTKDPYLPYFILS